MTAETANVLLMILPLVIALTGLTVTVLIDRFLNKEQKRILLTIVALLFSLIAQNQIEYRLSMRDTYSYIPILNISIIISMLLLDYFVGKNMPISFLTDGVVE